jgi:hypothetical protein
MKSLCCIILLALLVIAERASAVAIASDSLICSDGIVSVGDMASDLLRKCGQPAYTSQHEEAIVEEGGIPGKRVITSYIIDDWTFNFGSNRFQYRVLLKNGRVWKIESLEYGY